VRYWNLSSNSELDYYGVNDDPTNAAAFDKNGDGHKDLLITFKDKFTQAGNEVLFFPTSGSLSGGVPMYDDFDRSIWDSEPENGAAGILLADYDNDGLLDFYVPNHEGQQLYKGTNSGFIEVTSTDSLTIGLGTINAAWGDVDGDSFLDLFVLVGSQEDGFSNSQRFYHNVPDGLGGRVFKEETSSFGIVQTQHVKSVLWADFDGDHDGDLVVMQGDGPGPGYAAGAHNRYLENVDGTFVNNTVDGFTGDDQALWNEPNLGVVMDVDNDGDLDIAYHTHNSIGYFTNDGGVLSASWEAYAAVNAPLDLEPLDFDLDGRTDLLYAQVGNVPHDHPYLYGNRSGSVDYVFVKETISPLNQSDGGTRGVLPVDLNGDGFTELFYGRHTHADPYGNMILFKASPAEGHVQANWISLDVRCETGQENYYGIGATVIVTAGDHTQAQLVSGGGSGYASQPELTRLFGLGGYSGPVDVEIRWPSGETQHVVDLQPNMNHEIHLVPEVVDPTVDFLLLYDANGDGYWQWSWETKTKGDEDLDEVTLYPASHRPTPCVQHPITYSKATPGAVLELEQLTADGTWKRTLTVPRDCESVCKFEYTVESGYGTYTSTSAVHLGAIYICLQGS